MRNWLYALIMLLFIGGCSGEAVAPPQENYTPVPTVTEVQTQPEETAANVVAVDFSHSYIDSYSKETASIRGLDRDGNQVWAYDSPALEATQLVRITQIGIWSDRYYFVEAGAVVALDLQSGQRLWANADFSGSLTNANAAFIEAETGTVYLCGYFGPDIFIVDSQGNTLYRCDVLHPNYWWPCRMNDLGALLEISLEGNEEGAGILTKLYLPKEHPAVSGSEQAAAHGGWVLSQLGMESWSYTGCAESDGAYLASFAQGEQVLQLWISRKNGAVLLLP